MDVAPNPCNSCPYRCDVPSGVWSTEEYDKLRTYDDGAEDLSLNIFLCHQSTTTGRDTACRGWLTVAADSIAVRLACSREALTVAQRDAHVSVDLHPSGAAAADYGQRDVDDPSPEAIAMAAKLIEKRIAKDKSW